MSREIKQMEMTAVRSRFANVRDMVVMSVTGLSGNATTQLRANLRKKKIYLQVVKNSLTRIVFRELGMKIPDDSPYWAGPTTVAFGEGGSLAELSRALKAELQDDPKRAVLYKGKVQFKGAVSEGLPVTFEQAITMPTREEAIARVIGLALAPAARLLSQITGPASQVASQVKTLSEKKEEPAPAESAPAEPAPAEAAPPPA